jgi:hypothetical protein
MAEKQKKQYKYFYPDQREYMRHSKYYELIAKSTGYGIDSIRQMSYGNRKMPESVKQKFSELLSTIDKFTGTEAQI